ncbi:MAG: gamma-glutamylcyclotransferase [Xenococcus sp. (in: cyanobacteria)]
MSHWQKKSLISVNNAASVVNEKDHKTTSFYYFAYGSCMCPVDLKRSLLEETKDYMVGKAILEGYRLGFYRKSRLRNCGVLDIVPDPKNYVEGVLYHLPWRLSDRLDKREEVPQNGYRREFIKVKSDNGHYHQVRTYVVVNKLEQEIAPNEWYAQVVLRGAVNSGLSKEYYWNLFHHIQKLQMQA